MLFIDGLIVNRLQFLTIIYHELHYVTANYLPRTQNEVTIDKADEVIYDFDAGGFTVKEINCDKEFKKAMSTTSFKIKIKMNYHNSKEHTPRIERNNHNIKERVRSSYK